jgi:hypothetical protein
MTIPNVVKPVIPTGAVASQVPIAKVAEPKVIRDMTEAEILADASIEARPLMMPQQLDVKSRRPEYAFYWVNRKGDQGTRHEKFLALGFTNAAKEDVHGLDESVMIQGNSIILGDLILMKCLKEKYYGYLKYNMMKANNAVKAQASPSSAARQFSSEVGADVTQVAGKVKFYTPTDGELLTK